MEESIPTHSRRAWVGRCGGRPRPRGRLCGRTTHPSTFGGMARSWPKSRNDPVVPHSALNIPSVLCLAISNTPSVPRPCSGLTLSNVEGSAISSCVWAISHRLFSDGHQPSAISSCVWAISHLPSAISSCVWAISHLLSAISSPPPSPST